MATTRNAPRVLRPLLSRETPLTATGEMSLAAVGQQELSWDLQHLEVSTSVTRLVAVGMSGPHLLSCYLSPLLFTPPPAPGHDMYFDPAATTQPSRRHGEPS